jgi:TPR repeat protein
MLVAIAGINAIVIASMRRDPEPEVNPPPAIADVEPEAEPHPEIEEPPPVAIPVVQAAPAQKEQPPAPAAEDDSEEAYKLGLRYETGDGMEKDEEAAAICYEEAANAGHAESMYKIGLCYCIGKGVEKDEETGREWLKESAGAKHPDAQLALETLKVGVPAFMAAAWMTHPVGDGLRQKDKDKAEAEESSTHLSPGEIVENRIGLINSLLGKNNMGVGFGQSRPGRSVYEPWRSFNSPQEALQRDRFIRGTLKGGLPNQMPGARPR